MSEFGSPPSEITFGLPEAAVILEIDASPNYMGNWMNLQMERMQSDDFRMKFDGLVVRSLNSLNLGSPTNRLQKPENFQDTALAQVKDFDTNVGYVYGAVAYRRAAEEGLCRPTSLGHGNVGKQGTVFQDAITKAGELLTDRQKDIIAAHEAHHGIVSPAGSAVKEVYECFDWSAYDQYRGDNPEDSSSPNYIRKPHELLARMAQLKNYFGMSGGEDFTRDQLDYARKHYVTDTGLDNAMSTFFAIITEDTTDAFLCGMNTLPV